MKSIAIIGWWAAGLMAAASIVESHQNEDISLYLFEKNSSLGAKVIISGWGRCNVTTGYYRRKDLEDKYPELKKIEILKLLAFGKAEEKERKAAWQMY